MCGIVGYLGHKSPLPLIIQSLRQLEYRGYDSAGIAYLDDYDALHVYKASGKLMNLENILTQQVYGRDGDLRENGKFHVGIGHIRWATHGAANDVNAHPHLGTRREVALVHNGIIENFAELKKELQAKGQVFLSDTDTECVVQLLEYLSQAEADFVKVIQQAVQQLKGAYALSIICKSSPDKLYAVRNQAPLVIGVGEEEYIVASDSVAVAQYTDKIIYLKDHEIAEITPEGIRLLNKDGDEITPQIEQIVTGPLQIDKKGFKHFMLKEIFEQPDVIRNSLAGRLTSVDEPVRLLAREEDTDAKVIKSLDHIERILIIGCGTSYNAGLVGKYFIEEVVQVPVDVEAAGEFRYRNPVLNDKTLVITVSQSGETADTLAALRQAVEKGATVLAVTNREDSTIAREADIVVPVRAGVEVSVCATKSFTAQVIAFYLLGLMLAERRNSYPREQIRALKVALQKVPTQIEALLSNTDALQAVAKKYGVARDILFIARGINFPVALEGALKLKEISYIHAEGYSGSELKHGPIAMLDSSIPVIAVLVEGTVFDKMISNCQEAKARDARVIGVTSAEVSEGLADTFEDILYMPATEELLSPLIATVPLQLIAYYMAEYLGKDVDQPRNLAKSVTVE